MIERPTASAVGGRRLYKRTEATIYDCWCEVNRRRAHHLAAPSAFDVHVILDIHSSCLAALEIRLKDEGGQPFALAQYGLAGSAPLQLSEGRHELLLHVPCIHLAAGTYSLDISVGRPNEHFYDYVENALTLEVQTPVDLLTHWAYKQSSRSGLMLLSCELTEIAPMPADARVR
jgi:hypothetical protein